MIVGSKFVFLNLHHSGGAFVDSMLMKFVPDARRLGYHLPRKQLPAEYSHLPALGFVRNPWSFYASWYDFQVERPHPNFLFRILSDEGRLDFNSTVRNMLNLGCGSLRLDLLIRALPKSYGNPGLNLPAAELEPIRNTKIGFYTFLYRYLYGGGTKPAVVARFEELRADLLPMLSSVGQFVTSEMTKYVHHTAPAISHQAWYVDHYEESTREMVRDRDSEVIARHGYSFAS